MCVCVYVLFRLLVRTRHSTLALLSDLDIATLAPAVVPSPSTEAAVKSIRFTASLAHKTFTRAWEEFNDNSDRS